MGKQPHNAELMFATSHHTGNLPRKLVRCVGAISTVGRWEESHELASAIRHLPVFPEAPESVPRHPRALARTLVPHSF